MCRIKNNLVMINALCFLYYSGEGQSYGLNLKIVLWKFITIKVIIKIEVEKGQLAEKILNRKILQTVIEVKNEDGEH